jgi:hypothetical protein
MRVPGFPSLHLTYCQNIHPGETWPEHFDALQQRATAVKATLKIEQDFGLGLRLSAQAAEDLQSPEALKKGTDLFRTERFYPFSINGFPFGKFHRGPVKENVYTPDWRTPERLLYTCHLARILAHWLPEGQDGSISTVPGSFAQWIQTPADEASIARSLGSAAAEMAKIERETGRYVHLGLEPEPDCFLETTPQTLSFFRNALPSGAIPEIQMRLGLSSTEAEGILRRHIGVCFDTCHVALQYENLSESLLAYQSAGILLSKIQLSAALKAPGGEATDQALQRFAEPTYLHQVKARTSDGKRIAWTDLPIALAQMPDHPEIEELRIHFHVPLFVAPASPLSSTADSLDSDFWRLVRSGICPHLEIETYTFDVLPPDVHPGDIIQSIASEYRWVLAKLADTSETAET